MNVRLLSVVGATGSVGRQAIDVAGRSPDRLRVHALAAGSDLSGLAELAAETGASVVALASPPAGGSAEVLAACRTAAASRGVPCRVEQVLLGEGAAAEAASLGSDIVLNAVAGAAGLDVSLAALASGADLALANKESLIIGGELVLDAARRSGTEIIPVDSEHSAIAQALRAGRASEVRRLVLTASGGPFRGRTAAELEDVAPAQALAHPTWSMGPLVTTNSATLANKALEVIEAHLLFGVPYDAIEVVVHPQSAVHSMVEFADSSTILQASPPDMRVPLACALGGGDRIPSGAQTFDWAAAQTWEFEPVDAAVFPAFGALLAAGRAGGTVPALANGANEALVAAFLDGCIGFSDIGRILADVVDAALDAGRGPGEPPLTRAAVLTADAEGRAEARARAEARRRHPGEPASAPEERTTR